MNEIIRETISATALAITLLAPPSYGEPSMARVCHNGSRFELKNDRVERVIETQPFLHTILLVNKTSSPSCSREVNSKEFLLALDGEVLRLSAKDFVVGEPQTDTEINESRLIIPLHCEKHGVEVVVTYRLGHNDFYLHKDIKVDAGEHLLNWVDVESFSLPNVKMQRFDLDPMPFPMVPWDIVVGRPLFAGRDMFLGVEHPASINSFDLRQWISLRQYPGRKGKTTTSPAVIGFCPDRPRERLLDYFEQYVEDNRAQPLRRSVQWVEYFNVWMDDEACREKIDVAKQVFRDRGAPLDVVMMDSGWTDPKSIMGINNARPNRLALIKKLVEQKLDAELGLHVITSGVKRMVDKEYLAQQGYDMIYHNSRSQGAYCFADPRVFKEFRDNLLSYVEKYGIASYKFDWGHFLCDKPNHRGHLQGKRYGFEAGAENFRRVHQDLRKANPDIFLFNTGWYSPWWLWTYDTVFVAGSDYNFSLQGPPSYSTASLLCTWRDATIHGNIVRWSPFFPINSLMTCDPISYYWHIWRLSSESALRPFTDYFVTACLRGTQLTEIYNNIAAWSNEHADAAVAVLKWMKDNDEVILASTRYVGGDPLAGEPYGYAHFTKGNRGIIVIRNPSLQPHTMQILLDETAGMWPSKERYVIRVVYPFTKALPETVTYGSLCNRELGGHQVQVIEIWPLNKLPQPMPIGHSYQIVQHGPRTTTFRLNRDIEMLEFFSPVNILGADRIPGHANRFALQLSGKESVEPTSPVKPVEVTGHVDDLAYVVSVNVPEGAYGRVSMLFSKPKLQGHMMLDGNLVVCDAPHLCLPDALGRAENEPGYAGCRFELESIRP